MSRRRIRLTVLAWVIPFVGTACSPAVSPAPPPPDGRASEPTEGTGPAPRRTTCPQPSLTKLPGRMRLADRELVPFNDVQLGVRTLYMENSASRSEAERPRLEVISGGYVDDVIESYDNLEFTRRATVGGHRAHILEGSVLSTEVRLALWQDPTQVSPCDVQAVVGRNLSARRFGIVLSGIRSP